MNTTLHEHNIKGRITSQEDQLTGKLPHRKIRSQKDNFRERRPKRKMTLQKGKKTTSLNDNHKEDDFTEDNFTGRRHHGNKFEWEVNFSERQLA